MTFEAERERGRSFQEPGVGRAVGHMAGLAAIDANRKMFKSKGSALVGVAFEAGFLVGQRLVHHAGAATASPCRNIGAVGVMAVRALHESLIHAVLEGHRELRPNIGMATVAKVSLTLCQQRLSRGRLMD